MSKMLWEPLLKPAIAKAKENLGVNNIGKYLRYYHMYMARFKWKYNDKDITNAVEMKTFFNTVSCFYYDKVSQRLLILNVDNSITDENGNIIKVDASGDNNYSRKNLVVDKDCVLIYNDYTGIPPLLYIYAIANEIIGLEDTIREQNNMLRKPIILYGTGEQLDNALNNAQNMLSGVGFINLKNKRTGKGETIMDSMSMEVGNLQLGNSYKALELWENHNRYETQIKDYLGYASVNNEKKERMITDEVNKSRSISSTFKKEAIDIRKDVASKIKDILGVNVKLEVIMEEEVKEDDNKNDMGGLSNIDRQSN